MISKTPIQIRFRDTDGMDHINNAVYLTYLELARIDYFQNRFIIKNSKDLSFILARAEIDFKKPISINNHPVVLTWVSNIGKTSWEFSYKIIDKNGKNIIYALAKSIQVVYNYDKGIKELIPQNFKQILEKDLVKEK